jgi:hypothetical protein
VQKTAEESAILAYLRLFLQEALSRTVGETKILEAHLQIPRR